MYKLSVAAGLFVILGSGGCSSPPAPSPKLPPGAVPAGAATVTIQTGNDNQFHGAACQPLGGRLTRITAGESSSGIEMFLDNADGLRARSVVITNVDGFTGSYWEDAQAAPRPA